MSDYTQSIDFSAKDALSTGDPNKKILGADIDTELGLISTAIASKVDTTDTATTSAAGIVELATDAEALAGSSTTVVVTPGNLGSDQTKANTGHIVLPGNILLCWGRIAFVAATGPASSTFSKAFSGTPYSGAIMINSTTHAYVSTFNTTTISVTLNSSDTATVYYVAIGPA